MHSEDMRGGRVESSVRQTSGQITGRPTFGPVDLGAPARVREIADVDTLRVVADPTRVAILRVLMAEAEIRPSVMSAKEIAAELGESQTKLYRHLKQLDEAGLIQVAETRLVSGIVEQRYRAAQRSIGIDPQLLVDPDTRAVAASGVEVAFDAFREQLVRDVADGRARLAGESAILTTAGNRIRPARAAEFRARLAALLAEFEQDAAADGVTVHAMVAWYQVDDATGPDQDTVR